MGLLLANVGAQKEDIVIELSFALVSLTLCFLPGIEEVSPFLPMTGIGTSHPRKLSC